MCASGAGLGVRLRRWCAMDKWSGTGSALGDTIVRIAGHGICSPMIAQRRHAEHDLQDMQGSDERIERAHLPQAAEMALSQMRQGQDAEARVRCIHVDPT